MNTEVLKATLQDKSILRNLLALYLYDFSEIEGGDVDASGLFGYRYLDRYWTEPGRQPFLVKVDGMLAGFVLVSQYHHVFGDENTMTIAEFFIMRKYRGRGIGTHVAIRVFDLFPGKWEVRQTAKNLGAQAFWRKVVSKYTDNRFEEVVLDDDRWRGPVQFFDNADREPMPAIDR